MNYTRDFATIHGMIGKPAMTCVKPRTAWTNVPAGYTYNPAYDRYVNAGGTVWDETTVTLASDRVEIIPMDGQTLLDLIQGGVIIVGDRVVHIKAADYTTVNNAAWIVLDGLNYDKVEITPFPAAVPLWYIVNLRKR
jgi:hypothetical protein